MWLHLRVVVLCGLCNCTVCGVCACSVIMWMCSRVNIDPTVLAYDRE